MGWDAGNGQLQTKLSELEEKQHTKAESIRRSSETRPNFYLDKNPERMRGCGTAERWPNKKVMCRRGQQSTCATERTERGEEARE